MNVINVYKCQSTHTARVTCPRSGRDLLIVQVFLDLVSKWLNCASIRELWSKSTLGTLGEGYLSNLIFLHLWIVERQPQRTWLCNWRVPLNSSGFQAFINFLNAGLALDWNTRIRCVQMALLHSTHWTNYVEASCAVLWSFMLLILSELSPCLGCWRQLAADKEQEKLRTAHPLEWARALFEPLVLASHVLACFSYVWLCRLSNTISSSRSAFFFML